MKKIITLPLYLAAAFGCLFLFAAHTLASHAVTEAELMERLSASHGQEVGTAMAARVFQSREIPTDLIERRLIGQFGARWDSLSPDMKERFIADHRELLTNVARAEAARPPRGEFDPGAAELLEAAIRAEARRQERIELIQRTLRPTFPYDPGSPEPDESRHDNVAFRLGLEERLAQE